MAGLLSQDYQAPKQGQAPANNKQNPQKKETYAASIEQSASDYDELMRRYKDILDGGVDPQVTALMKQYQSLAGQPVSAAMASPATTNSFNPIQAEQQNYTQSSDSSNALNNLSGLSQTGGYSDQGIADLRSRGLSPIRAVYANAMENITRQKALQGGYSPNYTAAMAHLTRGLSNDISQGTQNVNAGIAQNVASNRLSAAGTYASAAGNENALRSSIESQNTAAKNDTNRYNSQGAIQQGEFNAGQIGNTNQVNAAATNRAGEFNANNQQQILSSLASLYQQDKNNKQNALEGLRATYGTTPANPALYGQQALQRASIEQNAPARKRRTGGLQLI